MAEIHALASVAYDSECDCFG